MRYFNVSALDPVRGHLIRRGRQHVARSASAPNLSREPHVAPREAYSAPRFDGVVLRHARNQGEKFMAGKWR